MTFNIEEKHAVLGAGAAMTVPVLSHQVGIDNLIVSFADAVFEGDKGSAAWVSGIGFIGLGSAMILGAVLGPFDGIEGIGLVGLGMGFVGLGIQTLAAGGNTGGKN